MTMRPTYLVPLADQATAPMVWTSRWSDGRNIPLGLLLTTDVARKLKIPDYYPRGLHLFSEEGGVVLVTAAQEEDAWVVVTARTRREACALFWISVTQASPFEGRAGDLCIARHDMRAQCTPIAQGTSLKILKVLHPGDLYMCEAPLLGITEFVVEARHLRRRLG